MNKSDMEIGQGLVENGQVIAGYLNDKFINVANEINVRASAKDAQQFLFRSRNNKSTIFEPERVTIDDIKKIILTLKKSLYILKRLVDCIND